MSGAFKTYLKFSLGTTVSSVLSLVSVPVLTWFVSPEELGKAAMFILAYNLLLNLLLLGLDQSFARSFNEVFEKERARLLSETMGPALLFTFVIVVLVGVFQNSVSDILFSTDQYSQLVWILGVALLAGVANRFTLLSIRMQNRAIGYSLLQIAMSLSNLIVTILIATLVTNDFRCIVLGFTSSQIITSVCALSMARSSFGKDFFSTWRGTDLKKHIRYGLPFVPTFLFDWVFQSSDRTLLRVYSDFAQIGIYTTATRISGSLNVLQLGFNAFWTPYVFERYVRDEHDKSFYPQVFSFAYLAFSYAILAIIFCRDLIYLILPEDYEESISLFPLILFVPMFYTLSEITGVGINLKRRTIFHLYIILVAAAINVCLGFFLIQAYGAKGAIVTNFCGFAVFFILRTLAGNFLYKVSINWIKFMLTILVVMAPVVALFKISSSPQHYLFAGGAAVIITLINIGEVKAAVKIFSNFRKRDDAIS